MPVQKVSTAETVEAPHLRLGTTSAASLEICKHQHDKFPAARFKHLLAHRLFAIILIHKPQKDQTHYPIHHKTPFRRVYTTWNTPIPVKYHGFRLVNYIFVTAMNKRAKSHTETRITSNSTSFVHSGK